MCSTRHYTQWGCGDSCGNVLNNYLLPQGKVQLNKANMKHRHGTVSERTPSNSNLSIYGLETCL